MGAPYGNFKLTHSLHHGIRYAGQITVVVEIVDDTNLH